MATTKQMIEMRLEICNTSIDEVNQEIKSTFQALARETASALTRAADGVQTSTGFIEMHTRSLVELHSKQAALFNQRNMLVELRRCEHEDTWVRLIREGDVTAQHHQLCHSDGSVCEDGCDRAALPGEMAAMQAAEKRQ